MENADEKNFDDENISDNLQYQNHDRNVEINAFYSIGYPNRNASDVITKDQIMSEYSDFETSFQQEFHRTASEKRSRHESTASIVDGLLSEIYDRWQDHRQDSFDSDTFTECSSTSEFVHWRRSSLYQDLEIGGRQIGYHLHRGLLLEYGKKELKNLVSELSRRVNQMSARLVRQLKRRERRMHKLQNNCDIVTAIIQASSPKRRIDTRMKFSVEPSFGDNAFEQWKDAMKAVARLPLGIPDEFRKKVWLSLASHHIQELKIDWDKTIKFAFNEKSNPDDNKLGLQIVKDLHRTGCSGFSGEDNEEERALLKRILLAYARWNKAVGYCQGFNVIAALLLEVMDRKEADALKVMIYLIDHVLPQSYFDNNLRALSVDMAVFRDLLKIFPKLSRHLDYLQHAQDQASGGCYEPPLTNVFTMQWFLTLFATCLPKSTVLRVWDCILLEGSEILLRTALTIWGKLSSRIQMVSTADEFYTLMGDLTQDMLEGNVLDADTVIKSIYSVAPFPFPQLTELREKYTYNIRPFTPAGKKSGWGEGNVLPSDEDDLEDEEIEAMTCFTGFIPMATAGTLKSRGLDGDQKSGSVPDISSLGPGAYSLGPADSTGAANVPAYMERMTTDISALKKQYAKLRQRQAQAHIILNCDEEQQSEDENIPALLPCSCSNSCGDKFTREEITQQIYSLREMEKGEKDLYIMGALNQLGVEKKEHGKRKWTKYQYKVKGTSVCREFFKVAHDIKDFTLRALIKHIKANGIVARVHGNTGRKPKHAVRYDDVKRVFNFIVGYADIHGMPQPAAPRGRDDIPPIFLHSSVTKKAVYDLYKQSCLEAQVRVVSLRIVYDIWNQCCSHIQIASPRHDVCAKCEKTRKKISDSVAEEDILASTRELQTHIGLAQSERAVYQLCIKEAKSEAEESRFDQLVRPIPPMSSDYRHFHYTFDFAQNVSIPHHARQMGPLYFLTPRKIQIFGFRNDSISEQMNYLIDENQTLGPDGKQTHGPNAVISMVDDGLTRSSFGEPTFKLHADNCGAASYKQQAQKTKPIAPTIESPVAVNHLFLTKHGVKGKNRFVAASPRIANMYPVTPPYTVANTGNQRKVQPLNPQIHGENAKGEKKTKWKEERNSTGTSPTVNEKCEDTHDSSDVLEKSSERQLCVNSDDSGLGTSLSSPAHSYSSTDCSPKHSSQQSEKYAVKTDLAGHSQNLTEFYENTKDVWETGDSSGDDAIQTVDNCKCILENPTESNDGAHSEQLNSETEVVSNDENVNKDESSNHKVLDKQTDDLDTYKQLCNKMESTNKPYSKIVTDNIKSDSLDDQRSCSDGTNARKSKLHNSNSSGSGFDSDHLPEVFSPDYSNAHVKSFQQYYNNKRNLSVDSASSLEAQLKRCNLRKKVFNPFPVKHVNQNRAKTGIKLGLYKQATLEEFEKNLKSQSVWGK